MKNIIFILCLFFITAFGKAQELRGYIQEAEDNNPEIRAYELRHTIAMEKINEVNTLPNTTISAGYFVSEPETRTGAQRARFSISQMLPWFGTITARENYASAMAETEFVAIAIARRKLALSVAQSYYELYALKAKQEILDENVQLLLTYERLALASVEVGKASAVDVLRLQIRQNELKEQKAMLQQEFIAQQTNFNKLRNQKASLAVHVVSELIVPTEDPIISENGLKLNPELLKYDRLYESIKQLEILNQKESAPDLGFGLDYLPVSERPDMNFSENGKDILMPMVTLSIPIFNNRYKSVSAQNELKQRELQLVKDARLNLLQTTLAQAISKRNQARIKFNTQERNLKQAKDAEEILTKNYETGTIDFNDVLDIQELQLKFQLNQIESINSYYVQSALINYLTN